MDLDARLHSVDELLEHSPEQQAPEAPSSGAGAGEQHAEPVRARPAALPEPAPQPGESDSSGPLLFVRRSPEEYSRLESVESSITAFLRRQASQEEEGYHKADFARLAGSSFYDFDGGKIAEIKVHLPPYDHQGSIVTMPVPMAMRVADLCQEVLREHRGRAVLAPLATYELRLYDEEDQDADYETPAFDENLRVGCLSTCDLALCPALSPCGTPPSPPLSCPSVEAEDLSGAALTPEGRGILAPRAAAGCPALRSPARRLVVQPGPPVGRAEDPSAAAAAAGGSSSSGDSRARGGGAAAGDVEAAGAGADRAAKGTPAGGALAWVGALASGALSSAPGGRIEVPVSKRPPRKSSDPEVSARTTGASEEDSPVHKLQRRVKSMPMIVGGACLESMELAMPTAGAAGDGGDTTGGEERRRWSSEDAAGGGARSSRQPAPLPLDGSVRVKQDQTSSSSALSAGRRDVPPARSAADPFSPLRWLEERSMTPALESRRPSPASFFFNEYTASIATEYFVTVAPRGSRARLVECMLVVDRERLYHQVPRGAAMQERKGSFMTGVVQSLLPQRSRSSRPDPAIFATRSVRDVRSVFCEECHERAFTVLYMTGGTSESGSLELTYEAQTPTECAEIVARMHFLLTL